MKFSRTFRVELSDIDDHKHVNNVAYLRWIQDVAVAHWRSLASVEEQEQYTWFVLRHEIDYKNRAFEGDEISAATWVGNATKIKCERFTEIYRGIDNLVEAKSVWCLFDAKTSKPCRITERLREIFEMS